MAQTYDQKQELLAKLWQALFPGLTAEQQARLLALPEPCHNHLHDRMRKEGRGQRLIAGCQRLIATESELFLEGLRLFPHAICRAAETIGPLPDEVWHDLVPELQANRLWQGGELLAQGSTEAFWEAVEALAIHRELPQPVLDFLESGRPLEQAPLEEFRPSFHRFLVRAKLEKMRFGTYAALKESARS